jgi:O-antigen/teichoic acid export membrane protein
MKVVNIAKNTSYFTLALIMQKAVSFVYFIMIARTIGPEDLGKYYFAVSFTTIFAIFIDVGMTSVLVREVAKHKESAERYIRATLGLKLLLMVFSLGTVIVLINLLGYPQLTKDLVYLSSVAMILDSFTLTFFGVSRGYHNLKYESVAVVCYQLLALALGGWVLYAGFGLRWLMAVMVIASLANFLYSGGLVVFRWKINILPAFNAELLKSIIAMALPFALFGIFQRLYTYFDSVLLSLLAGDTYVGLYSVAFKITFALQFLPLAFVASLYPAMSAYYVHDQKKLGEMFSRAMNYLIIIALPISAGIIILAEKIVLIFKAEYAGSILPLQIVVASLFFVFTTYPIGSLLNACDRQKINSLNMAIVLAVSIGMNMILIPRLQAVGASVTVLVTNVLLLALGMLWVPKLIRYDYVSIGKTLGKALTAAMAMAAALIYFENALNVFVLVALGGILYFGLLYIVGGYTKEDIKSIAQSFRM